MRYNVARSQNETQVWWDEFVTPSLAELMEAVAKEFPDHKPEQLQISASGTNKVILATSPM